MSSGHVVLRSGSLRPFRVLVAGLVVFVCLALLAPAARAETKPVNTGLPTITGTTKEGGTLKAAHGTWTGGGSISYSYQWQRCESGTCSNIATATEQTYPEVFADVGQKLRVVVKASNGAGSGEATSAQTGLIAGIGPKSTGTVLISGSAVEGQVLTLKPGSWAGTPPLTFSYQWERCPVEKSCTNIEGATALTYRVQEADVGFELRAKVTVTNKITVEEPVKKELEEKEEKEAKTSARTAVVTYGAPSIVGLPSITGSLRNGHTLTAHRGTWHGTGISYSETWESCNASAECSTASGSTYTLGGGDVGHTIKLLIAATNTSGSTTAVSVPSPGVLATGESFAVGWGEDDKGQLATLYKTPYETTPVVSEGKQGVKELSAGNLVAYELHNDGTVTAAGAGGEGGLGDELRNATWELGKSHVLVEGLETVSEISSGGNFALARQENGNIEAWGSNMLGELGNGTGGFEFETKENTHTPKEVKALHGLGVTSIASGGKANFAVLPSGEVKAWGYNNYGELSIPWPSECEAAKTCEPAVKEKHEKHEAATGEHICFTEISKYGQLCTKEPHTVMEVNEAKEEIPLKHVVRIVEGNNATYALLESGEVDSWGSNNKGQLGQEIEPIPTSKFIRPARVMKAKGEPLQHVVSIAAGTGFALAVLESGAVVGWGDAREGHLGEAANTCSHMGTEWACDRWATPISALEGVHAVAVAAGAHFSAVLGEEGKVHTVGQNGYGELGIGSSCENVGGELGYGGTCYYTHWQTVTGLEHVAGISAGGKVATAIVNGEGTPALPAVLTEARSKAVELEWTPPRSETAVRLAEGLWEHPAEEGAELEEGAEEPTPGGTGGTAPKNTVKPEIKEYELSEGKYVQVHNDVVVGIYLKATSGSWETPSGLKYSYRWWSCKSSKCSVLRGWMEGGEGHENQGELLQLPEQNKEESLIGDTIKVEVAAWHEGEAAGTEISPPAEEAVREGNEKNETSNLEGANGYLFSSLNEKNLEERQYELKLYTEDASKAQIARDFVVQPLP